MSFNSFVEKYAYDAITKVFPNENFFRVRPEWLVNPETNRKLELDFYCEELNLAIEMQGYQHYTFPNHFHKTQEQFEGQLKRDKIKREICLEKKIRLVLIPESDDFEFILNQVKIDIAENSDKLVYDYCPAVLISNTRDKTEIISEKKCKTCNLEKDLKEFRKNINECKYCEKLRKNQPQKVMELKLFETNKKICKICDIEKNIDEFNKSSTCQDGYRKECKKCFNKKNKERNLNKTKNNSIKSPDQQKFQEQLNCVSQKISECQDPDELLILGAEYVGIVMDYRQKLLEKN